MWTLFSDCAFPQILVVLFRNVSSDILPLSVILQLERENLVFRMFFAMIIFLWMWEDCVFSHEQQPVCLSLSIWNEINARSFSGLSRKCEVSNKLFLFSWNKCHLLHIIRVRVGCFKSLRSILICLILNRSWLFWSLEISGNLVNLKVQSI